MDFRNSLLGDQDHLCAGRVVWSVSDYILLTFRQRGIKRTRQDQGVIRILGVKGDPDHPAAKGLICRKMRHYEKSVHSPERILIPMKRVGAKGEGRFVPMTWDDAVKEIAGRWSRILEEDGADAILPMYYSGVMSVLQRKCGDAFFNRMGACDMVRTLCSSAKGAGYEAVMGQTGCLDPRELKDSSFYLVWGSNMKATRLQSMPALITHALHPDS